MRSRGTAKGQRGRSVAQQDDEVFSAGGGGAGRSRHGATGLARRCLGGIVRGCRRAVRRFHQGNSGSAKNVRGRRIPPGILRKVEAGDAAVVHVHVVREPDQDQNLSCASSRRRLKTEAALFAVRLGTKLLARSDQANLNYPML